jgi:hypothetical protein
LVYQNHFLPHHNLFLLFVKEVHLRACGWNETLEAVVKRMCGKNLLGPAACAGQSQIETSAKPARGCSGGL